MKPSERSTSASFSFLPWVSRLTLAGALLAGSVPASWAQSLPPRYRFRAMVGPAPNTSSYFPTVIDDFGRVAMQVWSGGGSSRSLIRTDGTTTELIADNSMISFGQPAILMQMNSSGTVAFCVNKDAGGPIYTWDGGGLTEVMNGPSLPWTTPAPPAPYGATYIADQSINASGAIVCWAHRSTPNGVEDEVFLHDGASTTFVVRSYFNSSSDYFGVVSGVRLLDDGSIAATTQTSMIPPQLLCDPVQSTGWTSILRLSASGGVLETLAQALDDDTIIEHGTAYWSANNSGDVIYRGGCGSSNMVGASAAGQFVITSEAPGSWVDFGDPIISNSGRYAFWGQRNGGMGTVVADGPDPVRNRVLATGDVIFGRTVHHVALTDRDSINDAGQICMVVDFTDLTRAVVRADPRTLRRR